jgi:hypothetical protein
MSNPTANLYLDEALGLGLNEGSRGYPPLSKEEMRILTIVAQNLFVSVSSMAWAFYEAQRGKSDSFKAIRDKLLSPPVRIMRA